ncbi:MAG: cytochrome C oxidase subunit IV family protein [Bacteroidales bacterium]
MKEGQAHVSSYTSLAYILIALLVLTTISVAVTSIHLGALSVFVALLIATVKVGLVITFFMHMKFESLFLKLMISGVFLLFALVVIITFIDYLMR